MVINVVLKSKLKIFLVLLMLVILIATLVSYVYLKNIKQELNGEKIEYNLNDIKSYSTTFDMTVISNKNINTYGVEEKCNIQNNHTILKFLDYMKNTVTIEFKDSTCTIKNSGNMLGLNTQITNNNKNISSISTFLYIYNNINGSCGCIKEEYKKDDEIKITLNICNKDNCILKDLICIKDLSKLELTLKKGKPLTYVIYDKNKKEYISILYNEFNINEFEN